MNLESSRQSYSKVRELLRNALVRRLPFSLVRVGDGESVIFNYDCHSYSDDLAHHLRLWFGACEPRPEQLLLVKRRLYQACLNATVLGVPTVRQTELHPRYQSTYSVIASKLNRLRSPVIADAAVHRFLHLSGDLLALLRYSPFLGLLTSRHLADLVLSYFKPLSLCYISIPEENLSLDSQDRSDRPSESIWLDSKGNLHPRYRCIPPYRGAPYLVAAGLMGKLICEKIRRNGGIAIDIGSIVDGWSGLNTRSYFSTYPSQFYALDHELSLYSCSSAQRLRNLIHMVTTYESSPSSFKLV